MADDKSKEIAVNKNVPSSVGIFGKYASGQAREPQPISSAAVDDKPKRKRTVIHLDQITAFSPIQPDQREFNLSISEDLELADSIKETGQNEPVLVAFLKMDGDKRLFELVNGHRRYGALKYNAGDKWPSAKLEAEILNPDEDKILVSLHANRGMLGLSPSQRGELYTNLQDRDKLTLSQICIRYRLDDKEEYIQRLIMAWKSPEPVQKLFHRGFPVNRTLDLRGTWNKLPEDWQNSHASQFALLSFAGVNKFLDRRRAGASPDEAFAEAISISPIEEIPIDDLSSSSSGQGANVTARPSFKTSAAPKGKVASKDDQVILEPMFYSLGLPAGKISELKRAGGSDSFDEKILAALAVRRGLDMQQSLTGARSLTHSQPLRHIAHRLVQDISKVLTKSTDVPEYAFLKYVLSFSDTQPSPQPADHKVSGKRSKVEPIKKANKQKGK
jgi:hypothetical protein